MTGRTAAPQTMAEILRARGKLGPYADQGTERAQMAKISIIEEETPVIITPYEAWLIVGLREECMARGLAKSGNKDELVARLYASDQAAEASAKPAGE